MRIPPAQTNKIDWYSGTFEAWDSLVKQVTILESKAGKGDSFQFYTDKLRDMAISHNLRNLPKLLERRVVARALTQLWLEDKNTRARLLTTKLLKTLVEKQQPRLGIIALHNLVFLYFREFDRLDSIHSGNSEKICELLQNIILEQLDIRFENKDSKKLPKSDNKDVLNVLHSKARWLLSIDGPKQLVKKAGRSKIDLADAFTKYQLEGLDYGRYADICRANYYLERLRKLPVGSHDEILYELLNPEVSKAYYESDKRIGHVALEIMIDRADGAPGEAWQDFILSLAGDPRISSSAHNFREWWKPLGEARTDKVRGWLSKEDLRLFLQALEEYGNQKGKDDLKQMFPARKRFLEGLEHLNLIRKTRLMLGSTAATAVRSILGKEFKTNYVKLGGGMSDKAVIYIDCGDFCLVEGSHSFKLWVYLAPPSELVSSYDVKSLTHSELVNTVPRDYLDKYDLPYEAIIHHRQSWQYKVFEFLARYGISLDPEILLSKGDYILCLSRFGMPVVQKKR